MKLVVISDIHGNAQALKAVLADIDRRQPDLLWCAGDLVGYGAHPDDVIQTIRDRAIPTVMGNYDDAIGYQRIACGCDYPDEAAMERGLKSVAWTKAHTTEAGKAFLRNLPYRLHRQMEEFQVALVHGSPSSLTEYLFADLPDDLFLEHLASVRTDVLIFGHTHKPYHKKVGSKHLINAGSVGKPKHGRPLATYVLVELAAGNVSVEIVEVPYDHEAAALAVEAAGLPPEFAQMLREGRG